MRNYKLEFVTDKNMFRELYDDSALTWEGLVTDDDNMAAAAEWLEEIGAKPVFPLTFYVTFGAMMNDICDLKGDNAYPDQLRIVSVKLEDLGDVSKVIMARFDVGARWFNDIVDNNARRQESVIDREKLAYYLEEEMITEFDSPEERMRYFYLYDGQSFETVDELKAYQGEYGFDLDGKRYHIDFDEALDVYKGK